MPTDKFAGVAEKFVATQAQIRKENRIAMAVTQRKPQTKKTPTRKASKADQFAAAAPNHSNGAAAATGELTFLRVTLRIEKSLADRIKAASDADAASKHLPPNMNTYIAQTMLERVKRFEEKGL